MSRLRLRTPLGMTAFVDNISSDYARRSIRGGVLAEAGGRAGTAHEAGDRDERQEVRQRQQDVGVDPETFRLGLNLERLRTRKQQAGRERAERRPVAEDHG